MVQRVSTVAFEGIEVRPVDVQVQVAPGLPAFTIVACRTKPFRKRANASARR
jgi:magnesium chelatase family protein